ncbi:MAG TPA: Gar1/Naf1 family protein [Methanobacterium sp.]|nr:Gar1/Naf1 family protein [Methanobacterium sp.]
MKKLGKISHISNRGRVIVRSNQTPGFGLSVFLKNQKRIGTVSDVFGPTKEPYISIKVPAKNSKNVEYRVGEAVYVSSKSNKKWGRRKRRKK